MDRNNLSDDALRAAGFDGGADAASGGAETADDILREIMKDDGTFNEGFNELFSRYLGSSADETRAPDLPDRTDARFSRSRVEYSADLGRSVRGEKSTSQRISEKLTPEVRGIYSDAVYNSSKPAFTNEGTVRYPSMGVGESEERVVFDADWEERAKEEAARREKQRRENMLRGDSAYTRSFQFSNAGRSGGRSVYNPFIDPLDDSQEEPHPVRSQQVRQPERESSPEPEKKEDASFFPEGFSASQRKSKAVSGKTEIEIKDSTDAADAAAAAAVNAAVLNAFTVDKQTENAFRDRWVGIVAEAKERRERKAAEEHRLQAVERAVARQSALEERVAAADKGRAEEERPLDLEYKSNKNDFEEIETQEVTEAELCPPAEKLEGAAPGGRNVVVMKRTDPGAKKRGLKRFAANNIPRRGDPGKEIARKVVRLVSLAALIGGLAFLAVYGVRFVERRQQTARLENEISMLDSLRDKAAEDAWADIKARYPDVDFPEGMQLKFSNTYAVNRDLVGWLKIEGTNISTPLVQTTNNYYYLTHDIFNKKIRYGNPFVSWDCKIGKELGKNTIVFGHNLHDGSLFHELTNYMTAKGYLKAPIVTLDTLYETTKWKIFAVMLTNSTDDMDNGKIFQYLYPEFDSEKAFLSKVDEIYRRSMIHTGVDVKGDDRIMTLYTCYTNRFAGGRLVVFARQLREGESEAIDESLVYYDSSAYFPAAYYGKVSSSSPTQAMGNERVTRANSSSSSATTARSDRDTTAPDDETEAPPDEGPDAENENEPDAVREEEENGENENGGDENENGHGREEAAESPVERDEED